MKCSGDVWYVDLETFKSLFGPYKYLSCAFTHASFKKVMQIVLPVTELLVEINSILFY